MFKKPVVIAEIGCNHKGEMSIAKDLIRIAKESGANVVKLQKRNSRELLSEEQYNAPHPNPKNSYGDTYGAHREFLEFDMNQHREIVEYCNSLGIEYSTSVWDMTSAKEIASLEPNMIKIPSAINTNFEMLSWLLENYKGDIHVSLGMTKIEEEKSIYELFEKYNRLNNLIIYSCTSGYPVPPEDVALLEISRINNLYKGKIKGIGFSGHHNGIAIDIAAYTLGAEYIERHYTINKKWKGTDHSASLEPQELKQLIEDLGNVHLALSTKEKEILDIESVQRDKLKFRG